MSVPGTRVDAPPEAARQTYPFTLGDLPYPYDALEPHIDQKTLQVHHRGQRTAQGHRSQHVALEVVDGGLLIGSCRVLFPHRCSL